MKKKNKKKKKHYFAGYINHRTAIKVRGYRGATIRRYRGTKKNIQLNPVKKYINSDTEKENILSENKNKAGIYM
jgi:hypothetical protein